MNIHKEFIEQTGQALRFHSWYRHYKEDKKLIKKANEIAKDDAVQRASYVIPARAWVSLCPFCNCMTHTVKKKCGKCGVKK